MGEIPTVVVVSALAFVSTSLDNLFLLMAVASAPGMRTRDAAIGYTAAVAVVLAVGVAGSYAFDVVADAWLRYLGLVPLGMGLWRIRRFAGDWPRSAEGPPPRAGGVASVFGVMLANSGDSLGVFTSLMGETKEALVPAIAATGLAMALLWALVARWFVDHPALAPVLRRMDRYGVPLVLVGLGLYILLNTSTDTV